MVCRFVWFWLFATTARVLVEAEIFVFHNGHRPTSKDSGPAPTSPEATTPVDHEEHSKFYKESIVYTTLAGHMSPFVKRFFLSKEELQELWKFLCRRVHVEDMALMALLGWTTVPLSQLLFKAFRLLPSASKIQPKADDKLQSGPPKTPRTVYRTHYRRPRHSRRSRDNYEHPFYSTKLYLIGDHIQQVAKIAMLVYLVDMVKVFCVGLGFDFCAMENFPHAVAQLLYLVWIAQRLAVGKKVLLRRYVSDHPETYGHMKTINRLVNAALIAITAFVALNILQVEMGVAVHSFLALGSVGTLALGLASQGITTQVLSGLMLASSDRIYEGDVVRFGNGMSGTIVQMGWLETIIRSPDEVEVSVPHADLIKQQVSNLSRVRYSQVHQVLKFRYSDAEILPEVITSIKNEIYADCPLLITDGTRPFRVYWSNYGPDALEVTVEAHFRLRILSDDYYDNRERVLMAIHRAVKQHDVYFAKEDKPARSM